MLKTLAKLLKLKIFPSYSTFIPNKTFIVLLINFSSFIRITTIIKILLIKMKNIYLSLLETARKFLLLFTG